MIQDKNMDTLITTKEEEASKVRNSVELMLSHLDLELKTKISKLIEEKTTYTDEIEQFKTTVEDIEQKLNSWTQTELITKFEDMLKTLTDINDRAKLNNGDIFIEPKFHKYLFYVITVYKLSCLMSCICPFSFKKTFLEVSSSIIYSYAFQNDVSFVAVLMLHFMLFKKCFLLVAL